jgi:hypothetical protein
VATGDSGCEAYTAIAWGVGLSHERSDILTGGDVDAPQLLLRRWIALTLVSFEAQPLVSRASILGRALPFRVPFWGSVNPSPLGDGMRSIRSDANVEVGEPYDMGL